MNEYMTLQEVAEKVGVSPLTVRRWWYSGSIVPPVRLSKRCLRWHRAKVELWLRSRIAPPPEPKVQDEVPA